MQASLDTAQGTAASPAHAGPALRCDHVTKRYRGVVALEDVSLDVGAAETVAVLGLNGAGKTSLLRLILDFSRADSGTIEIFGVDSREAAARRQLAFLPERFAPSPELNGGEVMQLMADLRGDAWTNEARDRVLGALDFPAHALKRPVREYSKGMTQKVGLAAALLSGAALTVLDEPMSGLDPVARITMRDALTTLRSANRALVFTTHSLHDLELLCDRMAVIHHGRLCFHGTPEALCRTFGEQTLEPAFIACLKEAEQRAG